MVAARQSSLDRPVAIKLLPAHLASSHMFRERFRREALAAAALHHPNVIHVIDLGTHRGQPYLVMELAEEDASAWLARKPSFDARINFLTCIASALDHAHGSGLLHRDVKPHNVVISRSGVPLLTDFGLISLINRDPSTATLYVGTPDYMAPEVLAGAPATTSSDIYSYALLAYEVLAGHLPRRAKLDPDELIAGDVGRRASQVFARALSADVVARPRTATDLISALTESLSKDRASTGTSRLVARFASLLAGAFLLALLPPPPVPPPPAVQDFPVSADSWNVVYDRPVDGFIVASISSPPRVFRSTPRGYIDAGLVPGAQGEFDVVSVPELGGAYALGWDGVHWLGPGVPPGPKDIYTPANIGVATAVVDPTAKRMYTAGVDNSGPVLEIDLASGRILDGVSMRASVASIALDRVAGRLYVSTVGAGGIWTLNVSNGHLQLAYPSGLKVQDAGPTPIVVDQATGALIVEVGQASRLETYIMLDSGPALVAAQLMDSVGAMVYDAASGLVFVDDYAGGRVEANRATSRGLTREFSVVTPRGTVPTAMAVDTRRRAVALIDHRNARLVIVKY